ncbi:MAG TPA: phosphoribosylglycinamide formyltransferase [Mycobacteriales bacterium]|nr:phosphoribosylglycinamide formyltransferase [Mycobacteriales bacterium]
MTARIVVLASGEGTNLQALLDACAEPPFGASVVAVGSDREGTKASARAESAGIATFVVRLGDCADRADFDRRTTEAIAAHEPDIVVLAGYMKLLGPDALARFPLQIINTHAALLPAFPGATPVADTLAYGVKVTGATVHFVDAGTDTGPVIAQRAVEVRDDDDEHTLHARIKDVERALLVDTVGRLARGTVSFVGRKVLL